MERVGFEIERKFLIAMPEEEWLFRKASRRLSLLQTYLKGTDNESARVRQITEKGSTIYVHTVKRRISAIRREETEKEISEKAYRGLLLAADPDRRPIRKTRYCIPYDGHILEIDVFPFWKDKAFLEIELSTENEAFTLPEEICVLREVTTDSRYTNAALARSLPES